MSNMVLPIMPSAQKCNPNGAAATFVPANDNYHNHLPQMLDGSATTNSLLFQQSQIMPNILSQVSFQIMKGHKNQKYRKYNIFILIRNILFI